MLDEIEQERDTDRTYTQKLEAELLKTKEILENNQLKLIDPLQNKIQELEKMGKLSSNSLNLKSSATNLCS
jgi:hypothetical protein